MNNKQMTRIEQTARNFVAKETKFANTKVVSVGETADYSGNFAKITGTILRISISDANRSGKYQ